VGDPRSRDGTSELADRMRVTHVVGARPNLPKLAPVHHALARLGGEQRIIHTGQHYDAALSGDFFEHLEIPAPDVNLGVGSGTHAEQTARVLERIAPVLEREAPDWLVVYGDVNSTVAAALAASKLGIRTAHVEAGLRSFDRTMPEEINRIVTDRLVDLLLTPSRDADAQLLREGEATEKIQFIGNVMIDTLLRILPRVDGPATLSRLEVPAESVIVTLHRPSNVDDPRRLERIVAALRAISTTRAVVLAAHPRTRRAIAEGHLELGTIRLLDPLPYTDLLALMSEAHAVVTDSGGVQEETTVLGVPCFTLRPNTERPITIECGTNTLVPEPEALVERVDRARRPTRPPTIEGWDGRAGERAAEAISRRM
jgi:UDP-N-acetylglucosamine 2-epimerase (non-hydrolysing)